MREVVNRNPSHLVGKASVAKLSRAALMQQGHLPEGADIHLRLSDWSLVRGKPEFGDVGRLVDGLHPPNNPPGLCVRGQHSPPCWQLLKMVDSLLASIARQPKRKPTTCRVPHFQTPLGSETEALGVCGAALFIPWQVLALSNGYGRRF